MPKRKQNQLGLTVMDYTRAFIGWKVTQGWLAGAFASNLTLEQAKALFVNQRAGKPIYKHQGKKGIQKRRLSLRLVKMRFVALNEREAARLASCLLMPDARDWLEHRFPQVKELSQHFVRASLAGSIELYDKPTEIVEPTIIGRSDGPQIFSEPVNLMGDAPLSVVNLFEQGD